MKNASRNRPEKSTVPFAANLPGYGELKAAVEAMGGRVRLVDGHVAIDAPTGCDDVVLERLAVEFEAASA